MRAFPVAALAFLVGTLLRTDLAAIPAFARSLWNGIKANLPLLDPRMGGVSGVDRYHSVAGGLGYLIRSNVRAYGEVTWDLEAEQAAFGLGLTAAC